MLSALLVAAVLAASPAAPRQGAAPSQEPAAVQLAREVVPPETYQRLIDGITTQVAGQIRAMAEQNGARVDAGLDDGIRKLYAELLPYQDMVDLQAGLLVKYFSEPEIVQLRDFYRTPLGKKMRDRMPEMMQDVMAASMQEVQSKSQNIGEALKPYIHEGAGAAEPAKAPAAPAKKTKSR